MFSFLKKNQQVSGLTGVAVRPEGVCVVRVVRNGGQTPRVALYDRQPLPDSREEAAKTLTSLARDYELKQSRCTTVLDPDEYALLITEAPDVPAEELRAAIRWRIKDLIDFHIDDAALDVFDIPTEASAGRVRSMYTVAARNEAIRQRAEWAESAGIGLEIVDITELAQRNLAALLPEDASGAVMVSFSPASGLITITKQGELYLSRGLDIGLDAILTGSNPETYFDRIVLEVQRSLDYFDSHFRQAPISGLVLAPLAEDVPGLLDYLDTNLDLRASMMDLAQLLEWEVEPPPNFDTTCLMTLGAALRQEERAL